MPLVFNAELSNAHVREATAGIFRRQMSKPMVLGGLAGLFGLAQLLLWAVLPQAHWKLHVMLALLMLITMNAVFYLASRYYQDLAQNNFTRFQGQPARVRLEPDAYHYQASWGQGSIEWARFQSLWCFPGVWVLLQHAQGGVSVLLPAASLDEEARAFLKARLDEVKAQVHG